MTTITHLIDTVTEWARVNICDKVELKQPPKSLEAPVDAGYEYKRVHPAVFPMYVPTFGDAAPNAHAAFPSLCVRFMTGADSIAGREGGVTIQLCFSAWNPGEHGRDVLHPKGDGSFSPMSEEQAAAYFEQSAEGWRDVWNFVDVALRAVESVTHIGNYQIDPKTPVEFGPLAEQEAIPDFYPFWFAWVSFRVTYPLRRNVAEYENFL